MFRPPSHVERLESTVLPDFQLALATSFQRCGKGAGNRGRRALPEKSCTAQVVLQRRPVSNVAYHARQDRTGINERPHAPPLDGHLRDGLALAQTCIGGQEVVETGVIVRLATMGICSGSPRA